MTPITEVRTAPVTYPLAEPFAIATGTQAEAVTMRVEVMDAAGHRGIGEAAPVPHVVGHDLDDTLAATEALLPELEGADPTAIRRLHRDLWAHPAANVSAIHALETALLDLCCRRWAIPMAAYLGGPPQPVRTDMTIPIVDPAAAAARARTATDAGFDQLKIKTGGTVDADLARVRAVADAAPSATLTVDANQGWTVDATLAFAAGLEDAGVQLRLLEQPLPADELSGLRLLRDALDVPIAVDESVFSPADAHAVIAAGAADIINIKLAKAGLVGAVDIVSVAAAAGVEVMIGCMLESAVGIHTSAHLVAGVGGFVHIDLDGNQLLETDVVPLPAGPLIRPSGPGHGIDPAHSKLR
jgi:L-alanine-DL-glutamate epimerase and related enzymes of enolase superfamily